MASRRDKELERIVMATLSFIWSVRMGSFGLFAPLDFWAARDDKLVAVMELKTHPYEITKYPTTQLNLRKWGHLNAVANDLPVKKNIKALYLKLFMGELYYIDVAKIPVRDSIRIGGCHRFVKSVTDIEPVIDIPIEDFTYVGQVMSRDDYDNLVEWERTQKQGKWERSNKYMGSKPFKNRVPGAQRHAC